MSTGIQCTQVFRMLIVYRTSELMTSLLTAHFPQQCSNRYTHFGNSPPLFLFFLSQPALTVGSLEVLCPSSPCPWELCLRAGACGVPQCTMCASHSGSRCIPQPLHGSGGLPSSEGLSVWGGGVHMLPQNHSKHLTSFFPHDGPPDINHFSRIGGQQWDAWEDVVMNNQTNCNKQCEVMCKWMRSLFFFLLLLPPHFAVAKVRP